MSNFVNDFVDKVLKEDDSFALTKKEPGKKDAWYYQFLQCKVGNGRYVYGCRGYNEEFYLSFDKEPKLVAIVADGVVYIVDAWFFDVWQDVPLPLNAEHFYRSKIKSVNEYFQDVIFSEFYNGLEPSQLTDGDCAFCAKEARKIMLSKKSSLDDVKPDSGFSEQDVAKILCGMMNLEEEANKRLEAEKEAWSIEKAKYEKKKEYIDSSFGVAEWELKIAEALRSVDAKNITVEFEYNGKKASEKMNPEKVARVLLESDKFDEFDFATRVQGGQVIKTLGASTSHWDENTLRCEHISKITYGKKELYVKTLE